ncbi:MAG TPA: ABC transporter permease [Bryobacteraceae bacterium]|nr:ABC transporter permease [Bryobacteraceae bacterium]
MAFFSRLFSRRRRYDDLAVSIREHLAERADELMADGMSRAEAEQTARREFGNVGLIEERSREAWQWPTLESMLADVRFALRQLAKSPGFTATAATTLALGIAVNATMFSMVSAFLMPRLPGRDPQRIVVVSSVNPDAGFQADLNPASAANYRDWKADTQTFSEMAAADEYRTGSLSGAGEQPEAITVSAISANYFSVFGVAPQLGRAFAPGEDEPGHDHVVILSHSLWERRFGADASVIGRTVGINREDYVVIGVMPADFRLLGFTPQLWTPLALTAADGAPDARNRRYLYLFARLAPNVTLSDARARIQVAAKRAQQDFPLNEKRWGASVRVLDDFLIANFGIRPALAVIMTVVGFVLLIACVNVAGLLFTRSVGRQKELAIRLSLGAGRVRIVRQLLTEGLVIALMGGAVGLILASFGIRVVRAALGFNEVISAVPVSLDRNVLLYAAIISIASAVLSSLAPALKASRSGVHADLKSESRGSSAGRSHSRMRTVLVGGEIALALFLLIGSALLIRGVYLLDHQKLGFNRDHLLTAGLRLDKAHYSDSTQRNQFVRSLLSHLKETPGVEDAAVTSVLPAAGPGSVPIQIKGKPEERTGEHRSADDVVVTPEYFNIIALPILRGRGFTASDQAGTPRVVVVSQEFARKHLAGEDALGKQVLLETQGGPAEWCQIIGITADVKSFSEDQRVDPEIYEDFEQRPVDSFSVMLRSKVEPTSLSSALRSSVARLDADLPLLRVMSMEGVLEAQRNGNPLFERLLATFAMLALILATIGIYGLIAYSVGQRSQEIGIRMALGAKSSDVSRMILREGLKVAGIGSAVGFVMAIPLPKLFDSIFSGLLFGAPEVYAIVVVTMLLVALAATLGPAQRATRVNLSAALRNE